MLKEPRTIAKVTTHLSIRPNSLRASLLRLVLVDDGCFGNRPCQTNTGQK